MRPRAARKALQRRLVGEAGVVEKRNEIKIRTERRLGRLVSAIRKGPVVDVAVASWSKLAEDDENEVGREVNRRKHNR